MVKPTIAKDDMAPPSRSIGIREGSLPTAVGNLSAIAGVIVRAIDIFSDERGWLGEIFRHDELPADLYPAMAYASMTRPGAVRGPHEHVHQTDLFAFVGPGDFELTLWDARPDSTSYGEKERHPCGETYPRCIIIPPGVVHAYKNISEVPGMVFNAPNRLYAGQGKSQLVDEVRHEDDPASPYFVD